MSGDPEPTQDVKEVWFSGCHSDVGGGAVEDVVRDSLANISLGWMVKEVMVSQCGIKFDQEALKKAGIPTLDDHTQPVAEQNRMEGPEPEPGVSSASLASHQDRDVLAGVHDELKIQPLWWLLELFPTKFGWQKPDGTWKYKRKYALANDATL